MDNGATWNGTKRGDLGDGGVNCWNALPSNLSSFIRRLACGLISRSGPAGNLRAQSVQLRIVSATTGGEKLFLDEVTTGLVHTLHCKVPLRTAIRCNHARLIS